jgi:hypothetical protein
MTYLRLLATYPFNSLQVLLGDLTPCVPLSLLRRGGKILKEGLTPLLNTPKAGCSFDKDKRKRGFIPLSFFSSLEARYYKES